MEFREIVEMVSVLTKMSLDTYMKYKYMILATCTCYESVCFFTELFKVVEKCRPKLLEMMKGGTAV